jgi:hypothetical protein
MSDSPPSDKSAAFMGLIVTTILIFVVVLTIVKLTNAKYAGHEEAAVETTK